MCCGATKAFSCGSYKGIEPQEGFKGRKNKLQEKLGKKCSAKGKCMLEKVLEMTER